MSLCKHAWQTKQQRPSTSHILCSQVGRLDAPAYVARLVKPAPAGEIIMRRKLRPCITGVMGSSQAQNALRNGFLCLCARVLVTYREGNAPLGGTRNTWYCPAGGCLTFCCAGLFWSRFTSTANLEKSGWRWRPVSRRKVQPAQLLDRRGAESARGEVVAPARLIDARQK